MAAIPENAADAESLTASADATLRGGQAREPVSVPALRPGLERRQPAGMEPQPRRRNVEVPPRMLRRAHNCELTRSPSCQGGPASSTRTNLPARASSAGYRQPAALHR